MEAWAVMLEPKVVEEMDPEPLQEEEVGAEEVYKLEEVEV